MRVYELAKELGVGSKDLLVVLKEGGFPATSHMVVLSDEALAHLRKHFSKSKEIKAKASAQPVAEKKSDKAESAVASKPAKEKEIVTPIVSKKIEETKAKPEVVVPKQEIETLPVEKKDVFIEAVEEIVNFEDLEQQELREQERIKRLLQSKGFAGLAVGPSAGARRRRRRRRQGPVARPEVPKGPVTEATIEKSMALFEVADLLGKPSGDLILYLLKKGMVCNRNHILTLDRIKEIGQHFGIPIHVKTLQPTPQEAMAKKDIIVTRGQTRWPVVVVMGHVDHGKTTLLDFIRKMNVAASEKGGITQHIRAWEVDSTHGKIVFLDTPGHEAFSYIRQRGSKVTDIVVLVVAVDDGIKPQTVEAINHAKAAGVPIIIAINKIDKMQSPSAIETVKRQLAQYELMPEEWGGQTIIVPISAKTGKGVDELLEMIVLQSQLMELKALTDVPAKAFVLESHIEKGFGPVATVITKEGILKQGDYFICGATTGKVRILVNSQGKKVTQATPSMPVQVVGFDTFGGTGDWLNVVSQQEYTHAKFHKEVEFAAPIQSTLASFSKKESKYINLIIKTDTRGSKEAIMGSIDKLIKQNKDIKCPINIVSVAIGDINESDIDLASNTDSIIVGFTVHVEKNAQLYAKDKQVDIQTYQIIYELIESLEKLLQSKKEIAFVWTKVGEATVKKVFDIKGVGIIAGCYMRDGVLGRGNKVVCVRSGKEIGEAKVSTLQRDRKAVKEIHAGFECGFTADGFNEWQEGDTVLVYAQTKAE